MALMATLVSEEVIERPGELPGETNSTKSNDIPQDPDDPRLTLRGAKVYDGGSVDIFAYDDLIPMYASEPSRDMYPNPKRPGVREGEHVPKGLITWADPKHGKNGFVGTGWIAFRGGSTLGIKSRKFNVRVCGSWRLTFLLARLQHDLWEHDRRENLDEYDELGDDAFEKLGVNAASVARGKSTECVAPKQSKGSGARVTAEGRTTFDPVSRGNSTGETFAVATMRIVATDASADGAQLPNADIFLARGAASRVSTSTNRKRRSLGEAASARKRSEPSTPSASRCSKRPRPEQTKEATKTLLIGRDVVTSSVRLQQILAARRIQEEEKVLDRTRHDTLCKQTTWMEESLCGVVAAG
eukprot:TRINITY_DN3628_c0_g2_i1.p1 TRINITY_DN3628_c0_g2~~TRINITY_DN3628_c0_g2_i1.p1  ORF type:complete len:356 (-),score=40.55 TRINITY_DN3628_c0_g2_i1:227-1294(-)